MKRRSFLKSPLAVAATLGAASAIAAEPPAASEWYELRTYSLKKAKRPLLDAYLKIAFLPTAKKLTAGPVGVFVEQAGDDEKVLVLTVHSKPESCLTLAARMRADADYQKAAADYLAARPDDPIYSRYESSVMVAIEGMPKLVLPDTKRARLLNLRIYESHNERAGQKKIEMFNKGELDIFKRVGLTPVFFAETIEGNLMPNLTYMLVFPDDEGRNAAWNRFRGDAEWVKLRASPEYSDKEIVLKVTNRLMVPTEYSEI